MMLSGPEKRIQEAITLLFLLKKTRRKSASLQPLIGLLALAVGKFDQLIL